MYATSTPTPIASCCNKKTARAGNHSHAGRLDFLLRIGRPGLRQFHDYAGTVSDAFTLTGVSQPKRSAFLPDVMAKNSSANF